MKSEGNNMSTAIEECPMDVDEEPMIVSEDDETSPSKQGKSVPISKTDTCRGIPLSELRQSHGHWGPPPLPRVHPSANHTVLYKVPWRPGQEPIAYPSNPCDRWDQEHVRMPNSSESLYPVQESEGEKGLRLRWELVQEALCNSILNSHQLEAAILSFNSRYNERWNFRALHTLFNEVFEKEETDIFFRDVMPSMVLLALQLPELITGSIPLLRKHRCHSLSLSQIQIGSLLANAFFCTFPRRNSTKRGSEYAFYPDINFNRLFQCGDSDSNSILEKLKCILNYFRRICLQRPLGVVTFSRRYLTPGSFPDWSKSTKLLPKMHITSKGYIEDEGAGMLQVDFANKFIGGGVLGWGCVQEEIRFVICPELIVSRLFTECLDATEALVIVGCERFSQYRGYGHTFEWVEDFNDETPLDSAGRRHCSIVAIDALCFSNSLSQYTVPNLLREVNKAYVGFREPDNHDGSSLTPVATGNWGCGAFRGDPHLKALLQLMAAGQAKRSVVYFTFGDDKLLDRVYGMYRFLVDNNVTVGKLWRLLDRYCKKLSSTSGATPDLYEFLYSSAGNVPEEKHDSDLKPAVTLKRKEVLSKQKPGSSKQSPNRSSTNPDDILAGSGLTSEDIDSLIEEFDSDVETANESPKVNSSKKQEPAKETSSSCLSLIEDSLQNEKAGRKACVFVKSVVHPKSAPSTPVKTDKPGNIAAGNSATTNVDEKLCANSSDKTSVPESDNSNFAAMGLKTVVDTNASEGSIATVASDKRSSAPKRKISDYFSPM